MTDLPEDIKDALPRTYEGQKLLQAELNEVLDKMQLLIIGSVHRFLDPKPASDFVTALNRNFRLQPLDPYKEPETLKEASEFSKKLFGKGLIAAMYLKKIRERVDAFAVFSNGFDADQKGAKERYKSEIEKLVAPFSPSPQGVGTAVERVKRDEPGSDRARG